MPRKKPLPPKSSPHYPADYRGASPEQVAAALLKYRPAAPQTGKGKSTSAKG